MRRYRATISFLMLPIAYLSFAAAGLLISGLIIQQTSELVRNLRIAILFVNIVAGAACGAVWFHVRRSTTYVDPVSDNPEPETRFQADKRGAFTLVELLVVIFLIAVLAGIAIMFFPNAASAQREARGAIAVQGWLNIAKQRALRDNSPRGVRFYLGTATVNGVVLVDVVTDAQYIEQPEDYSEPSQISASWAITNITVGPPMVVTTAVPHSLATGNTVYIDGAKGNTSANGGWIVTVLSPTTFSIGGSGNGAYAGGAAWSQKRRGELISGPPPGAPAAYNALNTVQVYLPPEFPSWPSKAGASHTNDQSPVIVPSDPASILWPIQPGDFVEFGGGLPRRIVQVGVPGGGETTTTVNTSYFVVTPPLDYAYPSDRPLKHFKVIRRPRVAADEALKLPEGVYVDAKTNADFKSPLPINGNSFDVLFAPNGEVISRGVSTSNLNLWVRAPNPDQPADPFRGHPTIISVFVRTGFAGSFDVDPSSGNPYSMVR